MMEAVASMEMAPGAIPRPGKVPKQRLLSPELGFRLAAELWNFSGFQPHRECEQDALHKRGLLAAR